jgi:hypothetical protein
MKHDSIDMEDDPKGDSIDTGDDGIHTKDDGIDMGYLVTLMPCQVSAA